VYRIANTVVNAAAPEPASGLVLLTGLLLSAAAVRRKRAMR
jgi:hypothetical protein